MLPLLVVASRTTDILVESTQASAGCADAQCTLDKRKVEAARFAAVDELTSKVAELQ